MSLLINWRLYGFVRIIIAFIIGILLADILQLSVYQVLSLALVVGVVIFALSKILNLESSMTKSSLVFHVFIIAGSLFYINNNPLCSQNHFSKGDNDILIGTVLEYPKTRNRTKTILKIEATCEGSNCKKANGTLLVYFPKGDTTVLNIAPGTKLSFKGAIVGIKARANPKTFDFKSYLFYRKVHHQIYLKSALDYKILSYYNLGLIRNYAQKSRSYLLNVLAKYITDPNRRSVVSAMVLGYRNQLNDEVYSKFTNSGAVHVLAVSGLHVGIVIGIFIFFFNKWKSKSKTAKLIQTFFPILIVWFYALMTGAAPAVLRASLMFSVWQIGRAWFSYYKSYNIMAFCGLLMLIYDPYLIFQASFQFSFISLLSILYFQPIISKLIIPKTRTMKFIWNMANVALAAQILVFPITLYFFHKFPTYFVITGIFAVPLAIIILVVGLMLLVVHFIPVLNIIAAKALNLLLALFLGIIDGIENLPFSSIDGVWISLPQTLLMYVFVLSLMAYLYKKRYNYLVFMGLASMGIITAIGINFINENQQREVIVYDSYKGSIIDFIVNRTAHTFQSSKITDTDLAYICTNYRNYRGVRNVRDVFLHPNYSGPLKVEDRYVQVDDKQFSIIDKETKRFYPYADYYIITNGYKAIPKQLKIYNDNAIIILDSTIPSWSEEKWYEYAESLNLQLLSTKGKAISIQI
jgi:competence protein ComEC